jgi:hypothetical protein
MDFKWEMFKILICRLDRPNLDEKERDADTQDLKALAEHFALRLNDEDKKTLARLLSLKVA